MTNLKQNETNESIQVSSPSGGQLNHIQSPKDNMKNIFSNSLEASLDPTKFTEDFSFIPGLPLPDCGEKRISFKILSETANNTGNKKIKPEIPKKPSCKDLNMTGRFPTFSSQNKGDGKDLINLTSNESFFEKKMLRDESKDFIRTLSKGKLKPIQISDPQDIICEDNITFQQRMSRKKIDKTGNFKLPQDEISEKISKFKKKGQNSSSQSLSMFRSGLSKTLKSNFQSTKALNSQNNEETTEPQLKKNNKKNPDINEIFQFVKNSSRFSKRKISTQKAQDTSHETYNLEDLKQPLSKYNTQDSKNQVYMAIDSVPSFTTSFFQRDENTVSHSDPKKNSRNAIPDSLPFPLKRNSEMTLNSDSIINLNKSKSGLNSSNDKPGQQFYIPSMPSIYSSSDIENIYSHQDQIHQTKSPVKREYFNFKPINNHAPTKMSKFGPPPSPNVNFSFNSGNNDAIPQGPFFKFDNSFKNQKQAKLKNKNPESIHQKRNFKKQKNPGSENHMISSSSLTAKPKKKKSSQSKSNLKKKRRVSKKEHQNFEQNQMNTSQPKKKPLLKSINRIRSKRSKKKPRRTTGAIVKKKNPTSQRSVNAKRRISRTKNIPNKTSINLTDYSPNKNTRSTSCYSEILSSTKEKLKSVSNISSVSPKQKEFINFASLRSEAPDLALIRSSRNHRTRSRKSGNQSRISQEGDLKEYFLQEKKARQSRRKTTKSKKRKSSNFKKVISNISEQFEIFENQWSQHQNKFDSRRGSGAISPFEETPEHRFSKKNKKSNNKINTKNKKLKNFFEPNRKIAPNKSSHFPRNEIKKFLGVTKRSLELDEYHRALNRNNLEIMNESIDFEIIHKGKMRKLKITNLNNFEPELETFAKKNSLTAEKVSKIRRKIREAFGF